MYAINVRNVVQALPAGLHLLLTHGVRRGSRNGVVREAPEPVATSYMFPRERVLFYPERDANPFFHLFESLWMMAGRDDVSFVIRLLPRMKEYSDNGQTFNGAYGRRWRYHFGHDQIAMAVAQLRSDPDTRRVVIQMWDGDEKQNSKDIPCNTAIYFKVRFNRLDMTVTNRSNDVLWGAYGANAVHMSMLQEYVADKAGFEVGLYTQISDSFHAYLDGPGGQVYDRCLPLIRTVTPDPYLEGFVKPMPLGAGEPGWDRDLYEFFDRWDRGLIPSCVSFRTEWWNEVAAPMWEAFRLRDIEKAKQVGASDWRKAAVEWLERRVK